MAAAHLAVRPDAVGAPPRLIPLWLASLLFWSIVVGVLAFRHSGAADQADVATFALVFASIAIEALPFILLGAIVSAAMAAFVPDRAFERIGGLPRALQIP